MVENCDFFSTFGVYIFRSFRVKANFLYIITYSPSGLPLNPKQMTLNDLEWLFYVCNDDHFAHFVDE